MYKNIKYIHLPTFENQSFRFDHVKIYWNEQVTFHEQKTWELSYIITGSGTRKMGDRLEPFQRNEIVLIPPHIPHCWLFEESDYDAEGKIENITLTFSDRFLDNCKLTFNELHPYIQKIQNYKQAISFIGAHLAKLQNILKQMIDQTEIERISSFIQILTLLGNSDHRILAGNRIEEDKQILRLQKIQLYIMNNYQNTITLEEMSQLVNMNKSSFCIFFKKMMGKSLMTYLNEFRVESSCQMIQKTNMTIAEVCYYSGFKDVPYYNRIFKKIKNCTPNEYRKRFFQTGR